MSDLQCAARFLLLPSSDVEEHRRRVASLRFERVARVYAAQPDLAAARRLAAGLGVPAGLIAGLIAGEPVPVDDALRDLADRHRGETVVVVTAAVSSAWVVLVDGDGATWRPCRSTGPRGPRAAG